MDREEERLKLEFDLLCWYNFYQKCHELEEMVDIKDDGYNSFDGSKEKLPDVTERKFTFSKNSKDIYINQILEKYINKNSFYKSEYELHKRKMYQNLIKCNERKEKYTKEYQLWGGIGWIIGAIVFLITFIISIIRSFNEGSPVPILIGLLLGALFMFITAVICARTIPFKPSENLDDILNDEKKYTFLSNITYQKWFDIYKFSDPSIKKEWENIMEKVDLNLNNFILYSENKIPELKEIKNKLKVDIPLPDKYSDEYHVKCLLSLVLDRRADTLKEAINLFEEEAYRSRVIQSLDMLNYNIGLLNRNILQLRYELDNSMRQLSTQMNVMIAQNFAITNQLQAINCSTRYLMIDSLFDND